MTSRETQKLVRIELCLQAKNNKIKLRKFILIFKKIVCNIPKIPRGRAWNCPNRQQPSPNHAYAKIASPTLAHHYTQTFPLPFECIYPLQKKMYQHTMEKKITAYNHHRLFLWTETKQEAHGQAPLPAIYPQQEQYPDTRLDNPGLRGFSLPNANL